MRRDRLNSVVLAVLLAVTGSAAAGAERADRNPPRPRFPTGERRLAPVARRPAGAAPADLVPSRPAGSRRAAVARAAPGEGEARARGAEAPRERVPVPREGPSPADVERAGLEAGARTADEILRTAGHREAYRVGLYDGQRAAFADPSVGRWDFEDGERAGGLDPDARARGALEGRRAADEAAGRDAARQVESQFGDLSWMPTRSPRIAVPDDAPRFAASRAPELSEIFAEYPPARVAPVSRRMSDGLAGWGWDPWRLHGCQDWRTFYDSGWSDPAQAFRSWSGDPRRAGLWRSLDRPALRDLFEAAFADGFDDRLAESSRRLLDLAYAEGFDDGWAYGAFVRGEYEFRRGYLAGFDRAIAFAAEIAFDRAYPQSYLAAYGATFDDWMSSSRPAILEARLTDANDDGIFQPGEDVAVEYVLANYGGAGGVHALRLEGAPLTAGTGLDVRLEPRARVEGRRPLVATLDASAAAPSREVVYLRLDDQRRDLPLRVSFPVEFTGRIGYESRPLDGRAGLRLEIANRSRKPVADVAVTRGDGPGAPERRAVGTLAPGASAEVAFDLRDVRPLDLIGGDLAVRVAVEAGGGVHDRKDVRFPSLATDLGSTVLTEYLVSLGLRDDADPAEAAAARRLLAQRLEADWHVRAAGAGNPYKDDAADGGARTALGELVGAYARERGRLSRSIVFHGLDDEVAALADRMPGAHPLLRRWMKQLAAKLG